MGNANYYLIYKSFFKTTGIFFHSFFFFFFESEVPDSVICCIKVTNTRKSKWPCYVILSPSIIYDVIMCSVNALTWALKQM